MKKIIIFMTLAMIVLSSQFVSAVVFVQNSDIELNPFYFLGGIYPTSIIGYGTAPVVDKVAGTGTNPNISVIGTPVAFKVTITTDTDATGNTLCTISIPTSCHVAISPLNKASAQCLFYCTVESSTITVSSVNALLPSTTYSIDFILIN